VHKHRNLLAHAPDRLHEEISADYNDMIYADSKQEIESKRKAFIRKWRLKCRAAVDSLEEAGDELFTFARFPKSQWKSIRTSNAIEHLHEEFKRRIKTQTVLPPAETAAMLFWALLASGQITMRILRLPHSAICSASSASSSRCRSPPRSASSSGLRCGNIW
jgi:transposase-like protein